MTFPIPDAALSQHIAVLGKTGAGKTITAKGIVEHVVKEDAGARVCVLDTIKSDWWGLTSSADGERAGLPFHILGGPRGHVPLHESAGKAIGELVATGQLPLSVIDMADFKPGGQMQFFAEFAPQLFKRMRGVVYLVLEEAHILAPKERAGFGHENLSIHWAKTLATAARSRGIRLIVATQRTQALHNAVLGSCDTMIAHRLTAPADKEPVVKWLKDNVDKEFLTEIAGTLSSLPTGTAWVCSGEAKFFERVKFPMITTFDNSATPEANSGEIHVQTAPVDRERLRAIIGTAVQEAEENDPKRLKAENAQLKSELARGAAISNVVEKINTADIEAAAEGRGFERGLSEAQPDIWLDGDAHGFRRGISVAIECAAELVAKAGEKLRQDIRAGEKDIQYERPEAPARFPKSVANYAKPMQRPQAQIESQSTGFPKPPSQVNRIPAANRSPGDVSLTGPQRKLLQALAWWRAMGHDEVSKVQAATLCNWKITSSNIRDRLSELSSRELVTYPRPGMIRLTEDGIRAAPTPEMSGGVVDSLRRILTGPQLKLFEVLLGVRDKSISKDDLAISVGWSTESSNIRDRCSELSSMEIIQYPQRGHVALQDWITRDVR